MVSDCIDYLDDIQKILGFSIDIKLESESMISRPRNWGMIISSVSVGILCILTANDFILHLTSLLKTSIYPLSSIFGWVFYQGWDFYNTFWAIYWGLRLACSLYLLTYFFREPENLFSWLKRFKK